MASFHFTWPKHSWIHLLALAGTAPLQTKKTLSHLTPLKQTPPIEVSFPDDVLCTRLSPFLAADTKDMALTMQCCLTVNSIGPHAIASFLDRCLLEMDMAHAIPGSDPLLKHVAKLVLSTKTDTSFRQIHELTEQNPNTNKICQKIIQNISMQM